MSVKNVKVRFNMDKENDCKAYAFLQEAEGSYSKTVISAICGYMELCKKKGEEDAFLERVLSTIREEVSKSNPLGGLLQFVQTLPQVMPDKKEDSTETEEAMLDFLDNF